MVCMPILQDEKELSFASLSRKKQLHCLNRVGAANVHTWQHNSNELTELFPPGQWRAIFSRGGTYLATDFVCETSMWQILYVSERRTTGYTGPRSNSSIRFRQKLSAAGTNKESTEIPDQTNIVTSLLGKGRWLFAVSKSKRKSQTPIYCAVRWDREYSDRVSPGLLPKLKSPLVQDSPRRKQRSGPATLDLHA